MTKGCILCTLFFAPISAFCLSLHPMSKSIINVGILAHVDAGKTTLTEQLLYHAGAINEPGNVDKGSATTDQLEVEKLRGISVKTSTATFFYQGVQINLIDTPGHADFISEVERALQILDCAILVISSVEGLQSQTYSHWQSLKKIGIPTLVFVNKVERSGSQFNNIIEDLNKEFKANVFPLSVINDEAEKEAAVIDYQESLFQNTSIFETNLSCVADFDEAVLSNYLDAVSIDSIELYKKAIEGFRKKQLTPVCAGIAKNGIGITNLLIHLISFVKTPVPHLGKPTSAIVYKTEHHLKHGLMVHVKLLSGSLKNKDFIYNQRLKNEFKISQLKKQMINRIQNIEEITAGDIGILAGLTEFRIGDILGYDDFKTNKNISQEAILISRVKTVKDSDIAALAKALTELNIEDPSLDFKWFKSEDELQVKLHGPIQKEIIQEILLERYQIEAVFEDPSVIYKETPVVKAEGFVRYWMPKPCWAIMKFEIEPGERGSGVVYESKVGVNDIHQKYQNEVAQTIHKSLEQGIKGWEVTDLKIKLIEGEDHPVHSRPGDFKIATPMGIMNALQTSNTQLLEPMLKFTIKANESLLGVINSELIKMRAEMLNPEFEDDDFILNGHVPVATSMDLSIKLNSLSSGKAKYLVNFGGYRACSDEEGQIRPYKGISPLDESLWILHARGAYKA